MCARYLFELKLNEWSETFALVFKTFGDWSKWNIAPTNEVPIVRPGPKGGLPRADLLRWGLVPKWAKSLSFGARTINARSETAAEKPAFRSAFRRRRCLVPASGFYEWTGPKSDRRPHLIQRAGGAPMTFAGLWDRWTPPDAGPDADAIETFTILTCPPNAQMEPIHDRMPVILPEDARLTWLSEDLADPGELLVPYAADDLRVSRVSTYVNNVRNQGKRCISPSYELFP